MVHKTTFKALRVVLSTFDGPADSLVVLVADPSDHKSLRQKMV